MCQMLASNSDPAKQLNAAHSSMPTTACERSNSLEKVIIEGGWTVAKRVADRERSGTTTSEA